jgi:uncharacterized protein HemX
LNLYKVKKNKNLNLKQKETNNLTVIHYNLEPLDNLIKIQTLDSNLEYLAMSPASQNAVREELRIRILTARALLLSGLIPQTSKEISEVKKIVEKNFLPNDGSTQKTMEDIEIVLANLRELEKKNAQLVLPAGDKK